MRSPESSRLRTPVSTPVESVVLRPADPCADANRPWRSYILDRIHRGFAERGDDACAVYRTIKYWHRPVPPRVHDIVCALGLDFEIVARLVEDLAEDDFIISDGNGQTWKVVRSGAPDDGSAPARAGHGRSSGPTSATPRAGVGR